ncbi:MAG: M23 family metallopeptidase [Chitinophagaceae bacterium]|nr:M23 family metallopeptidase [Chitinophagaceae bacterium]
MQLKISVLTIYICIALSLSAQPPAILKNYFRNPVDLPMELSANFGELRPDHWHMGLDIRTAQKENQSILAAADGYIASIGIRASSFGRFIIINHPNGLSTLYAHLNDFYPGLEKYVIDEQYRTESWAQELTFTKDQFPVSKGQFIAFSGNTGGSQGPHLHFEIFITETGERLNPLLFNFPLQDITPPALIKLAMYDRSKSVYEQVPVFFTVKNTDSGYIIPKPLVLKTGLDKVSFAIQAYDKTNSKSSQNGIYAAKLFLDDEPQVEFILDSISYEETAYINSQIDYKFRSNGGAYLQHVSRLPGDHGNVYKEIAGSGVIDLTDTLERKIKIEVRDAHDNLSELNFVIQHDDSLPGSPDAYSGIPKFIPNQVNEIKNANFEIYLPEPSLYDTVPRLYYVNNTASSFAVSAAHQVSNTSFPLNSDAYVRIKPSGISSQGTFKDKLVILRTGGRNTVRKAKWEGDWLTAKFGDFGAFQAFTDLTAPQINELGKGDTVNLSPASRIVFTPTDNFGIKSFRAELDSQWIRFTNDKGRNWIYIFDERCPFGIHHLKVTVEDLVGNTTTKEWWFKRYPYTPPKKKAVKKKSSSKKKTTSSKKVPVKKKK